MEESDNRFLKRNEATGDWYRNSLKVNWSELDLRFQYKQFRFEVRFMEFREHQILFQGVEFLHAAAIFVELVIALSNESDSLALMHSPHPLSSLLPDHRLGWIILVSKLSHRFRENILRNA